MKVPVNWLKEYCDPHLEVEDIARRLAATGTEVERITHYGVPNVENYVVGQVVDCVQHPDADRLKVCKVDVGQDELQTIVCGAPNVAAGQIVPVALPGAVLLDGSKLKPAKLRGVKSHGMILAADELGVGVREDGILVLSAELRAGTALANVLLLQDKVLELEITPNRPDCLSVYGIARELHAATEALLGVPSWLERQQDGVKRVETLKSQNDEVKVTVLDGELCSRFTARVFEGVQVGPSPLWLQQRLLAAGMRPISNVVDITNYVMLVTGQPLHAYDLDSVTGRSLTVRRAKVGETLTTLDDLTRKFDDQMVVVCDGDGPNGIGGLMGAARSEVLPSTQRILVEAATWHGPNIHRTSSELGLRTEASTRFEKQLPPDVAPIAQILATDLLVKLCGATPVHGMIDLRTKWDPPQTVTLRTEKINRLLGKNIPTSEVQSILTRLGFANKFTEGKLSVKVPPFRTHDVTREVDLIEEVVRIHGLDDLPTTLPNRRKAVGRLTSKQSLRRKIATELVSNGLCEVVGWSFTTPELADRLQLDATHDFRQLVKLANPMSEEQAVLRPTLLGSLLDIAGRNHRHGVSSLQIFELGTVYAQRPFDLAHEQCKLGILVTGPARAVSWRDAQPPRSDFFTLKGLLEGFLTRLGIQRLQFTELQQPFLHPGRSAAISSSGMLLGWIGELHPSVAEHWGLEQVSVCELSVDALADIQASTAQFVSYSAFPPVRQDLAVVVADDLPYDAVRQVIQAAGGDSLSAVELFDVYRGEQVGSGKKSLALSLQFNATDKTFTDSEVNDLRARITEQLEKTLGAVLRG